MCVSVCRVVGEGAYMYPGDPELNKKSLYIRFFFSSISLKEASLFFVSWYDRPLWVAAHMYTLTTHTYIHTRTQTEKEGDASSTQQAHGPSKGYGQRKIEKIKQWNTEEEETGKLVHLLEEDTEWEHSKKKKSEH